MSLCPEGCGFCVPLYVSPFCLPTVNLVIGPWMKTLEGPALEDEPISNLHVCGDRDENTQGTGNLQPAPSEHRRTTGFWIATSSLWGHRKLAIPQFQILNFKFLFEKHRRAALLFIKIERSGFELHFTSRLGAQIHLLLDYEIKIRT